MFFTYPIAATTDNWISSTLLNSLRGALAALQAAEEPADFQDSVPEVYRAEFLRGRRFSELYCAFIDLCRPLGEPERQLVLNALVGQNQFPDVLDINAQSPCILDPLPEVHLAARKLFEYAFGKLSDLKTPGSAETVRARYHRLVHDHIDSGCCPFCGLEFLEAPDPDLVDPDLDHYLAVSKYPFAGANLRNLTAMGTACNRSYKGAQDILLNEANQKVDCIDPYGEECVSLSLDGTVILSGEGAGPAWAITFDPDLRSRNWRRVFNLESRLRANVLEKQYKTWLKHCVSYAKEKGIDLSTKHGALEAVTRFRGTCKYETFPTIASLKTKFFELVETALVDPEAADRVHNFLIEATEPVPA